MKEPRDQWWHKYQVQAPEGEAGPWRVERFEVAEGQADLFNTRLAFSGHGSRSVRPGAYTRLVHRTRGVVMSDTPAEIQDHIEVLHRLEDEGTRSVLINGLGLGMVLRYALRMPHVGRVDVVEIDPDVVRLVSGHYHDMAERLDQRGRVFSPERRERLVIHEGDAYEHRFPPGTRWDVAWHDVWDTISVNNLPEMATLNRRYGRRAGWQGCWAQEECRREARKWSWLG